MFINARLRPDLNGFRAFVPPRIVELSYHGPNSMTNHGTNAWSNLRPVAPSAAPLGSRSYRSDAAGIAESYSDALAQSFFSGPSQVIPSYAQARLGNKSILAAPKRIEYPQTQFIDMMQLETQSPYDLQELQSPHLESAMPLLGANANSPGWIIGYAASSSRSPRAQYSSNAVSYVDQPSLEVDDNTSMSSSTGGPSLFSLYDASPASDRFGSNDIERDTVYPSLFEQRTVSSSSTVVSFKAPAVQSSFDSGRPWHEMTRNSNSVDPCSIGLPFTYDGPPNAPSVPWPTQSGLSSTWSQQTAPPGTISPQALSLVAPPSSPILDDNSPRSSSGWLSETSVTSQVFQESTGDVPYPLVQSERSRETQAQSPDGGMPDARVRSGPLKAVQIHSPGKGMADSKFRHTASQGFRIVQPTGGNANPVVQPIVSQEFQLQRSISDMQNPTTPSIIPPEDNVERSTDDLSHGAIGSVLYEGFQTQVSAGEVQRTTGRVLRRRRKLPAGRTSEMYIPTPSRNVGVLSRSYKGLVITKSRIPGSRPNDRQSSPSTARQYPKKTYSMQRPLGSEKSETKTTEVEISGIMIEAKPAATISGTEDTAQQRIAKDKFLLDSKREGKSYKQIRLEGGFTEAESTLRGRHRTLTKKPEERVRKPEWESNDLRLLKKAVHKLVGDSSLLQPKKVSWKEVSDYIVENGGSYRFGNSTCRKKWSELFSKSSDQDFLE